MTTWNIHNEDAIDGLRRIASDSQHAMLTDPPYGLSDFSAEDVAEAMRCWLDGKPYLHGKSGFMGRDWDGFVPGPEVWRECYRVLKPGGFAMVFSSSRTSDLMSMALRLAGFRVHPMMTWQFGCLSEDTEILVDGRWERYDTIKQGRHALCFDLESGAYQWQPIQQVYVYDYDDTAYRVQSDHTDQIVTRTHRCIVERGGKFSFIQAESAAQERQASVPVPHAAPGVFEFFAGARQVEVKTVTTVARFEPFHLKGIVWCVKVPTGAFVCRRNGQIFVTGNSGFPKASRIDTKVDEAAGVERDVVGEKDVGPDMRGGNFKTSEGRMVSAITVPTTDLAKAWSGHRYGLQALKPAAEYIIVAQKPYDGKPIDCITSSGAGALNIDGGRIAHVTVGDGSLALNPHLRGSINGGNGGHVIASEDERRVVVPHQSGRWPANIVLTHTAVCKCVGQKKVKAITGTNSGRSAGVDCNLYGKYNTTSTAGAPTGKGDADGTETVSQWHCAVACPCGHVWAAEKSEPCPECGCRKTESICPIARLDRQAGSRGASAPVTGDEPSDVTDQIYGKFAERLPGSFFADEGGPSRFFHNSDWAHEIAERLAGVDSGYYCAKAGRRERNIGVGEPGPLTEHGTTLRKMQKAVDGNKSGAARNTHPTIKPIGLIKHLATLLLPPDKYAPRRIVVPFSGSGSEMIGCMLAGWDEVTGIEKDTEHGYVAIAEARLAFWREQSEKHGPDAAKILKAAPASAKAASAKESGAPQQEKQVTAKPVQSQQPMLL